MKKKLYNIGTQASSCHRGGSYVYLHSCTAPRLQHHTVYHMFLKEITNIKYKWLVRPANGDR